MTLNAVVRVRGSVNIERSIKETMRQMRLGKVNHCVLLPSDDSMKGMLQKVKDYVTWGEVEPAVLVELLRSRGRLAGDAPLTDQSLASASKYKTVDEFAKGLAGGAAFLYEVRGLKPLFRLHPPLKGHGGIKRSFRAGGSLGYRGKEINALLLKMISQPPSQGTPGIVLKARPEKQSTPPTPQSAIRNPQSALKKGAK